MLHPSRRFLASAKCTVEDEERRVSYELAGPVMHRHLVFFLPSHCLQMLESS